MSFGYSVGDIVAIGTLAWGVFKSCKEAPESFGNISSEVLSLHAVLKEAEETIFVRPLSANRQEGLKAVGDGCHGVLKDLDKLVKNYESLGTQTKRTWDRMRWNTGNVSELRARLISNTLLLNTWIRCVSELLINLKLSANFEIPSTSQVRVERRLEEYSQEFRKGRRQDSVMSDQTVDSLCEDEKPVWRTIRKELEDIGITVAAFDANKDFIFEWFSKAVASGAFEERPFDDSAPLVGPSDEQQNGKLHLTSSRLSSDCLAP
jgi:hypothetical protein